MPKVDWESHRSEKRQLDPTIRRIRSLLTILLLAVLAYLLLGGSFRVAFDEESFGISAGRFGSEHIYFSDISALELRDGPFTTGTALDHKPSRSGNHPYAQQWHPGLWCGQSEYANNL